MIDGLVLPVHQLYCGGNMIRDVMKYELETKKKHLLKLQEYFRTAINALLEMKKVKTEIEQLEYYLQLKT